MRYSNTPLKTSNQSISLITYSFCTHLYMLYSTSRAARSHGDSLNFYTMRVRDLPHESHVKSFHAAPIRWIQRWIRLGVRESEQHSLRSGTMMSLPPTRRTGPGVQCTLSERLSLTPRKPNAPYVRPPPRYPTDANAAATRPGGGRGRTSESQRDDVYQKILDEVRRVHDEQKSMPEEVRTSQLVPKLEYKKLTDQLK